MTRNWWTLLHTVVELGQEAVHNIAATAKLAFDRVEGKRIRLLAVGTEPTLPLADDEVALRLDPATLEAVLDSSGLGPATLRDQAEAVVFAALYAAVGASQPEVWGALLSSRL